MSEKHLLLTLSLSGGCGRRGSLRTECGEHWPGSPNTGIQKPGWPPTSHMTQSPSRARLPSRSLFTSGNCGTTKRAIKAQSTLKPTLNKCKLWSFLRYKSPGKRLALFLMAEAGFTKGLKSSVLLTGHHGRTSFQKTHL